jgi:UDP-2,3-diacylglucosamine pyrophosphatase LpxH
VHWFISDLHLGSPFGQQARLYQWLLELPEDAVLIINGDLFDSIDRLLRPEDWKVLKVLEKLANQQRLIWITGNHDTLTNCPLPRRSEWILTTPGPRLLISHGHRLGDPLAFLKPLLDRFNLVYLWLTQQGWAGTRHLSAQTTWWRRLIRSRFIDRWLTEARRLGCQVVVLGHLHLPEALDDEQTNLERSASYYNTGSWIAGTPHVLKVDGRGQCRLEPIP